MMCIINSLFILKIADNNMQLASSITRAQTNSNTNGFGLYQQPPLTSWSPTAFEKKTIRFKFNNDIQFKELTELLRCQ
jgi:hypothetical protein